MKGGRLDFSHLRVLTAMVPLLCAACASPPPTLTFRYPDGQVCTQQYDPARDVVSCSCPGGFSSNYSKYTPNDRRTAVHAFCLSLADYQEAHR